MARKISLPITRALEQPEGATPTVDAIRARLGGRVDSSVGEVGEVVRVDGPGGRLGVVLHVRRGVADVYLDRGIVRRTPVDNTTPERTELSATLQRIADDARVFASLAEGQRVGFATGQRASVGADPYGAGCPTDTDVPGSARAEDGAIQLASAGKLIEKCRFGALVMRDDGVIVGVGFRKLWPEGRGTEQN